MTEEKSVKIGEAVVYVDSFKREHLALVTNVFGSGARPAINCVYVTQDESKGDTYGRQLERSTSVCHISVNQAQANCWKDLGE